MRGLHAPSFLGTMVAVVTFSVWQLNPMWVRAIICVFVGVLISYLISKAFAFHAQRKQED